MKLSEVFDQLTYGELRTTSLMGEGDTQIQPHNYPKIVPLINLALTEIYKRYPLKTKQVTIQQYENIHEYVLDPMYAQTNNESNYPWKYIKDTSFDPFTSAENVLKIEAVFREDGGEYILNDQTNPWSLFTPTYNSVSIPYTDENNVMTVAYRAGHDKLVSTGDNVLNQTVNISDTYLTALLTYVAAKYFLSSGQEPTRIQGATLMAQFENSITGVKMLNLANEENTSNTKLEDRGFR